MQKGYMQIIYGPGKGKTALALGKGLSAVTKGKTAVLIQFLQGDLDEDQMAVYNRLGRGICADEKNGFPGEGARYRDFLTGGNVFLEVCRQRGGAGQV